MFQSHVRQKLLELTMYPQVRKDLTAQVRVKLHFKAFISITRGFVVTFSLSVWTPTSISILPGKKYALATLEK